MTYTVSDYLLDRLAELGLDRVFGVPGDFNLQFLDHLVSHKTIRWTGNANELNAGYAADGYARMKGLGALVTTYGVGELSAINALAGAYAEHVPVIHIVGAPSKDSQAAHLVMHHTLGDGDFTHFRRMAEEVTCASSDLDHSNATLEIDRVLREVLTHRRPGYLLLATDVARLEVSPPSQPLEIPADLSSKGAENALRQALEPLLAGKSVSVLADLLVHRMGAQDELTTLLEETRFPYATLMWGKTLVNESAPEFAGIYGGVVSDERTKDAVENPDVLISAGVTFTDTTTAGFSQTLPAHSINITAGKTVIATPEGKQTFAPLSLKNALRIVHEVALTSGARPHPLLPQAPSEETPSYDPQAPLTQDLLWDLLSTRLTSNNIVVADQGTSFFGMASRRFPKDSVFIGQPLWGSIGYTLPALLGACLADSQARGVLLIGDGSAQLTLQEIGTILRERLTPVIVLINNDGYTVERAIHGPTQPYNDIQGYNWQLIPKALGARDEDVLVLSVSTPAELLEATEITQNTQDKLIFIEVKMDKDDVPQLLADVAAAITRVNQQGS